MSSRELLCFNIGSRASLPPWCHPKRAMRAKTPHHLPSGGLSVDLRSSWNTYRDEDIGTARGVAKQGEVSPILGVDEQRIDAVRRLRLLEDLAERYEHRYAGRAIVRSGNRLLLQSEI